MILLQLAEEPSSRQEVTIVSKRQLYIVFKKYLRWSMKREDMIDYLIRNGAKLHDQYPRLNRERLLYEQLVVEGTQVKYLV